MIMVFRLFSIILILTSLLACKRDDPGDGEARPIARDSAGTAVEFVMQAEQRLEVALEENERAAWVYSTLITPDTERLAARSRSGRLGASRG